MTCNISLYQRLCQFDNNSQIRNFILSDQSHDENEWDACFDSACSFGNISLIRLLQETKIQISFFRMLKACESGHLNIIQFLLELYDVGDISDYTHRWIFATACKNGHMHIINYLEEQIHIDSHFDLAFLCACEGKHKPVIQFLIRHGAIPNWKYFATTSKNDILNYKILLIECGANLNDVHFENYELNAFLNRKYEELITETLANARIQHKIKMRTNKQKEVMTIMKNIRHFYLRDVIQQFICPFISFE